MPGDFRGRRTRVTFHVSDEHGRPAAVGLSTWLAGIAPSRVRGVVNVALVSDSRVRTLNRHYRGIDCATDVLSFPSGDPGTRRPHGVQRARGIRRIDRAPFLGDIVIARGVARRQARALGHREAVEVRVLALHGLLHLLGYDHEQDAGTMARVERRLRRKGGLRAGLIERQ